MTLILIAILSLTACGERREIARELKAFRESTITIPEDLQGIAGGRLMLAESGQDNSPKFIVYHDSSASFRHANNVIPDDEKFHAFLIDGNGRPRFVGNPMEGDAMRNLFLEALGKTLRQE